ncbi:MAG: TraR/DksA C4-type zinc finger protein [Hydrogenibacillus schlegelii]|uniref:TraR/DksA C4-type zinc finger protein n=1 Tax=Hydrogenibacillus schlegelii TaxID=1484 RepID=A0A947G7I0_HYDSH|nr:TraR/DksA C4-type zinc finger protein [Hydrogenibacillus schlegelii]
MADRETYRRLLLAEREALRRRLDANERFGLQNRAGVTELSQVDNHPADVASDLFEREKDSAHYHDALAHWEEIDAALRRLDDGTYGVCERCGSAIDPERLWVVPTARYCIHCQMAIDEKRRRDEAIRGRAVRPAEEERIVGVAPGDDAYGVEGPGVDGEDIWQMLEPYGTSDGGGPVKM